MFAESLQKNFWGNARVSFKPFLLGIVSEHESILGWPFAEL